jgi:four helix bundle protein
MIPMLRLPYQKLQIWQKGMTLAEHVFDFSKQFPKEELYGMTSQIRRSAASIPANIAEGSQRGTNKDFSQFIHIARGSLAELETHLLLAQRTGMIKKDIMIANIALEIEALSKMLNAFHKTLITNH